MFAIKTQSVIWMAGQGRRHFVSTYILPDGFESKQEAAQTVIGLGLHPMQFRYIRLMNQWYAVFLNSYYMGIVLSKEHIASFVRAYEGFQVYTYEEFNPAPFYQKMFQSGKMWTDGIAFDLSLTENGSAEKSNVYVEGSEILAECFNEDVNVTKTEKTNSLIAIGLPYYYTAVKMNGSSQSYAQRIFRHYFSDYNCIREIENAQVYEYYNPIRHIGYDSRYQADKERDKVLKANGIPADTIPLFERPWHTDIPGIKYKNMRPREVNWRIVK